MLNTFATPNTKYQVTLPKSIRDYVGITPTTTLYITVTPTKDILIQPFEEVHVSQRAKNLAYLKILKKTQGAWAGDDWPETEAKQKKIEIAATKKLKKAW